MDVLYQSPTDGMQVALGKSATDAAFSFTPFANFVISSIDDPNCAEQNINDVLSIPNSNAFIDLDGDCLPDLFLTMTNDGTSYYRTYV